MTQEAMKLALGQLQAGFVGNAMQILREALAEHAMQEVQRLGQEIEQEPLTENGMYRLGYHNGYGFGEAYGKANAPQRTWVGLTDEDMADITSLPIGTCSMMLKVEAKLKEKNT